MSLVRRYKLALLLAGAVAASACAPMAIAMRTARRDAGRRGERAGAFAHASIIGGGPAADGTFPSLAYILDVQAKAVYQCIGTVVAPSLVLTAGHCAENMKTGVVNQASGYRVVTGAVDPMTAQPTVSTVLRRAVSPPPRTATRRQAPALWRPKA